MVAPLAKVGFIRRNFSTENEDAREAFVRYAGRSGMVTVGRQKIVTGSERLIGMGEWTNVGRSFDCVRFQNARWDAFAGTVGVSRPRPRDARIVEPRHHARGVVSGDADLLIHF